MTIGFVARQRGGNTQNNLGRQAIHLRITIHDNHIGRTGIHQLGRVHRGFVTVEVFVMFIGLESSLTGNQYFCSLVGKQQSSETTCKGVA